MSNRPLAWVKRIAAELPALDAIPLFGNAPPFAWEAFSHHLASRFGVPNLSIRPGEQTWRTAGDLKQGLGTNLQTTAIGLSPLKGDVLWMMPREDVGKLTSWLLNSKGSDKGNGKAKNRSSPSEILQEGFYRYLLLDLLDALQKTEPLKDLTLHVNDEEAEEETSSFCIDIEIALDRKSCWGRLAIPAGFRESWVRHFAKFPRDYIPSETARQTVLTLGIKVGSVILKQKEWNSLQKGDFLILDKESYHPKKETGVATLMLGPTPLFNVRIKQNKIELLDFAFIYEDPMEQKGPTNPPKPASHGAAEPAEEESVSIKEMPLFVSVELARLKVTLEQLMQLSPGNMLELPIHPSQGVSLTVNGQAIGRAELVYLGETLGLRILEIG